ncbi:type II secretion system protein GspM [Pseudomonas sp. BMS12]|uniref:type II secretion system protein GspM n=1 Tax=Pseudomonas sp. BMS12 TaxID=1796033 RepID=UPI00083B0690|nr:type II secretion system protein GspM [Pseudomonas sp. BMS12]
MNKWLQRWLGLAPREQWLTYGVGLALLGMLYLLLVGDPLAAKVARQEAAVRLAEARAAEASAGLADLQARLAADPNIPYRSALLASSANREELIRQIDNGTAELVTPEKMKAVLQSLLQAQQGLGLVAMQSFSEPVQLPDPEAKEDKAAVAPVTLYRHGLVLQLEGGYFDLLNYLQAVQSSGWKLNWDSLDYRVGEAGPGRAQISLKLFTLSRKAGWVGV